MSWTTLILLLTTNPLCGFIGYLLGRTAGATVRIEATMAEEQLDPDTAEGQEQARSRSRHKKRNRQVLALQVVAAAVVVIGLVTAVVGFTLSRSQDRLTGCVVGYSNALGDALERRAEPQQRATDQVYDVMRTIVQAYATASPEAQEKVRLAIENALASRERAKAFLREHPLPEVPRDACSQLLE